jgi:colicin import membrane protein
MKGPSLQKTAVLSAGLHITFFLLAFLVLRQSTHIVMPSPYVVSLVSPGRSAHRAAAPSHSVTSVEPRRAPSPEAAREKEVPGFDERKAEKLIDDRIAALAAKRKIRKIVEIRNELNSIRGRADVRKNAAAAQSAAEGEGQGQSEATYIDRITGEIHEGWQWPDYMKKDLEAVVAIKIQRDGTISQVRFEKKSGDRFFDRAALQAIAKASPVTPPPYEMEIGVRFYP